MKFSIEWNNLPNNIKVDPITIVSDKHSKNKPNINMELLHLDPIKIWGIYYEKEETK